MTIKFRDCKEMDLVQQIDTPVVEETSNIPGLSEVFIYGIIGTSLVICGLSCCCSLYKRYKQRKEIYTEEYFNL
jgi:hypothetical protein